MSSTLNAVTTDDNRILRLAPESLSPEECDSVVELALRILQGRHFRGDCLDSPATTRQLLQLEIGEEPSEHFGALFVDTRHRLICREVLFHGTIDGTSVYPRVVLQKALEANAAAVVFYHNHPSGDTEPSQADRQITQRLKDALALVDIRVLDHIIVSFEDSLSFAEQGLI